MAQLVQAKAQEVVSGLRDAAKIEVVDPELKKSMDAAAAGPGRCAAGRRGGDGGAQRMSTAITDRSA